LEFAFDSKLLRAICETEFQAQSILGPAVAEILKHRLADLRTAKSIKHLVAGRPHISDAANDQFIVELCDNYRIIFCANHIDNPKLSSGEVDWLKVSRIKILAIERGYD